MWKNTTLTTFDFQNFRSRGEKFGFAASIESKKVTCNILEGHEVDMGEIEEETQELLDKAGREDLESDSDLSDKPYPLKLLREK